MQGFLAQCFGEVKKKIVFYFQAVVWKSVTEETIPEI